jgi:hypothetical protein
MIDHKKTDLPAIAYLLAFLGGVFAFLLFGESWFGITPNLVWIAALLGTAISSTALWIWIIWRKRKP